MRPSTRRRGSTPELSAPAGERCPDNARLAALVLRRADVPDRLALEQHLDLCPACRRTTVEMMTYIGSPAATSELPATADELHPGDKVGRHILIGRIGAGAMGTVYAAYDTALERKIALKFLLGATEGQRLIEEASTMARLSHPNVVTVHDVGMWEGKPYLAMEYVKGQTLDEWRRTPGGRRPREVLEVMAAVARGLEAAHAAGIVHRDVKPHNVLVADGRVLVTDFGLSVREEQGDSSPAVAGTPLYMAPEQIAGGPVTPATDVFGFCVTLYETLYGQHPFKDDGAADDLRARVLGGQVRPPPPGHGVRRHVQRLVLAGLAVDPAVRPAGMGAIAATLLDDPWRRRRRLGALVLATSAVAGAFWVGARIKADPARRCQANAAVMDALWSDGRRQQLSGGHEIGAAAAAWQTLARRFDQYAREWRDMFTDTCRAAFTTHGATRRGTGPISGEVFDLRMNCLDSHRATFAAVLGSLSGASVPLLQKVAASSLPPVAECGTNELQAALPLPADPVGRARVAAINEMLAQVDAALAVGDFGRAQRLATEAAPAARNLGYQPLAARAINKLASVELRGIKLSGSTPGARPGEAFDRATTLLEEASVVAEAGHDDASRAEAASELVLAHLDAGHLAEAERWVDRASAIVRRIGAPPLYQSALDYARGWVQRDRQDMKAAAASFGRALRLRQQLLDPRSPEVLASKTATCAVMDRDQRIKCYREAIALAQTIAGPRHPDLAGIKARLAYVLVDDAATRGEACQLASEAVVIERNQLEANHIGFLRAMLALAQCRRDQGRTAEARRVYLEAIASATHPTAVRADLLQDYGASLALQSDYPNAIAYYRRALADHELVLGPTHHKAIETRQRIAVALREEKKLGEALAEVEEAIATCDRAGAMPLTYPELFEEKGMVLTMMHRPEAGHQALLRALELHEKVHTPEVNRGHALSHAAEVEELLGKYDQALAHLEKAMTVWSMESAPVYHGAAALLMAGVLVKQDRASTPRACELARRALVGFSQPFGGSLAPFIARAKRFLAAHRCGPTS
jgi:tetratricopeptide (TPR) repeat protein/predicted Ser/Thr protein kinase